MSECNSNMNAFYVLVIFLADVNMIVRLMVRRRLAAMAIFACGNDGHHSKFIPICCIY